MDLTDKSLHHNHQMTGDNNVIAYYNEAKNDS